MICGRVEWGAWEPFAFILVYDDSDPDGPWRIIGRWRIYEKCYPKPERFGANWGGMPASE